GFAVVVYTVASLDGQSIDDVAYTAFNTWKIGSKEGDDGVLLVIAPKERATRIETGKGVGGALTDLESHHINRDAIWPGLRAVRRLLAGHRSEGTGDTRGDRQGRRGSAHRPRIASHHPGRDLAAPEGGAKFRGHRPGYERHPEGARRGYARGRQRIRARSRAA